MHLFGIQKVLSSCVISSINLEASLRVSTRAWSELTSQWALKLWSWAARSKFQRVTGRLRIWVWYCGRNPASAKGWLKPYKEWDKPLFSTGAGFLPVTLGNAASVQISDDLKWKGNAPFFFIPTVKLLLEPWILLLHGIHTSLLVNFIEVMILMHSAEKCLCRIPPWRMVYPFNSTWHECKAPEHQENKGYIKGESETTTPIFFKLNPNHPFFGITFWCWIPCWNPGATSLLAEVRRCPAFASATFDVATWWWVARNCLAAFEKNLCDARAWGLGSRWTRGTLLGTLVYEILCLLSHYILTSLRRRVMKKDSDGYYRGQVNLVTQQETSNTHGAWK